jgi:integrase
MPRKPKPPPEPTRRAWGSGSLGVRRDGRPYAQIRLPDGRRLTRYGSTRRPLESERKALAAWLADVHAAVERGRDPTLLRLTFAEWAEDWLAAQDRGLDAGTLANYRRRLAMFRDLDRVKVADLRGPAIQRVLNALTRRYAPGTVSQARTVLAACLAPLVRHGPLDHNPVAETKPPPAAVAKRRVHSAEQAGRYRAAAWRAGELGELCLLVQETGMRSCEVRALRWADLVGERVAIQRRLSLSGRDAKDRSKTPAGTRVVRIGPELAERLERRRGEPTAYVFHRPIGKRKLAPGNPPTADDALRAHKAICRAAELEAGKLHDLRHGMVTLLRRRGVSVEAAQGFVGHRDLKTTLSLYRELDYEDIDEAAAAVAEYLRPVPSKGEQGVETG